MGNVETPSSCVIVTVHNTYILTSFTQDGRFVTLTAIMYYKGSPLNVPDGRSIKFYEETTSPDGTVKIYKSSKPTKSGIATLKFTSKIGSHIAYASFKSSGGIPNIDSDNTVNYFIDEVYGLNIPATEVSSSILSGFTVNTPTPPSHGLRLMAQPYITYKYLIPAPFM